ncbi:hypothetical protein ACX0G9_12160 [Flavitalea flava]
MNSFQYKRYTIILIFLWGAVNLVSSCKKYAQGFLGPYAQYPKTNYSVPRGQLYTSDALNPDGSSGPLTIKLLHAYDDSGNMVDSLFTKTYPVVTWTSAFDFLTDSTDALIAAKQKVVQMPAIIVNSANGAIEGNSASLYFPMGTYTFDLQLSNNSGTEVLKKIVSITVEDQAPYQATVGYNRLFLVGNESSYISGATPIMDINWVPDTSNEVILKIVDKNGMAFNPLAGEIRKRPNKGVNPIPPFLQTLEDYTKNYSYTDTTMIFRFFALPFPFSTLGNGFNLYYRIPTQFIHIDGTADDSRSANPRISLQVFQLGKYAVTIMLPDIVHR